MHHTRDDRRSGLGGKRLQDCIGSCSFALERNPDLFRHHDRLCTLARQPAGFPCIVAKQPLGVGARLCHHEIGLGVRGD